MRQVAFGVVDDIVALVATTDEGRTCYFMTWGRIQHRVDPGPVESIVLAAAAGHKTPGRVVEVRICQSLQDACSAPWFYESFFGFCQKKIPYGRGYRSWAKKMDERMRQGHEIAGMGPFL